MDQLFTIGQLSKLYNIKIPTLRYYDEVGLLKPAKVDPETHYRYYSSEQFERLNSLSYLKTLDLSNESIKHFFDARDISTLEDMLKAQRAQVHQQIAALENVERRINTRLSQVEDAVKSSLDKVELVELPEIPMIYLDEAYQLNEDIEMPISTLRKRFGVDNNVFLGKIALTVSQQQLEQQQFDRYSGLLMILEPGDSNEQTGSLPAGKYLRLRFHGTHETATEHYLKLLDYCQTHNYQINGDAVETTLIDYGITNDFSKYITEIRVPIK